VHVSPTNEALFVFGDRLPLHKNHDTMKTPKIEDYVNLALWSIYIGILVTRVEKKQLPS
jgi:hypothetical protein